MESWRIHLQDVQEKARAYTSSGPLVCQTRKRFRSEAKVE